MLADGTDGSSRVMGRVSGPSTRRPHTAAPMRRLPDAAEPSGGSHGTTGLASLRERHGIAIGCPLAGAAGARVGAS